MIEPLPVALLDTDTGDTDILIAATALEQGMSLQPTTQTILGVFPASRL